MDFASCLDAVMTALIKLIVMLHDDVILWQKEKHESDSLLTPVVL